MPSSEPSCDLVFSGDLLPDADTRQARLRLTAFFKLADPAAVEPFFRGGAVTLRRSLPRAEAQTLCDRLIAGGLDCHLIPSAAARPEPEPEPEREPEPDPDLETAPEALQRIASAPPPNLFQIRRDQAAQNPPSADSSQLRFLATAIGTGLACLALIAALLMRMLWWSPTTPVSGPESIVAAADGTLYILAGDRLLVHNRAGSSTIQVTPADLGLRTFGRLLQSRDGGLLLSAIAAGGQRADWRLWECSLATTPTGSADTCTALTDEPLSVDSLAASGLTDALFSITAAKELLRLVAGQVQERVQLPDTRRSLRLVNHRGLLMINTSAGPGLGVYRPDAAAFGQQLDEVLLLHPEALARAQDQVIDFAPGDDANWVLLRGDDRTGLYGFDGSWAPLHAVPLPSMPDPHHLATWRDRVLVYSPENLQIERINAEGRVEAPLLSDHLTRLAESSRSQAARDRMLFTLAMLMLAVAAASGGVLTWISFHRRAVLQDRSATPAFLLEHRLRQLQWLHTAPERVEAKRKWGLTAIAAGVLLLICATSALTTAVAIILPLFLLALAAWHCLGLSAPQIGLGDGELAVVDHRGVYQTGPASSFRTWGPFIFRGGVIACLGLPGVPGLVDRAPLRSESSGGDIDLLRDCSPGHAASALELLVQSRHPLILPALAVPAGLVALTLWIAI